MDVIVKGQPSIEVKMEAKVVDSYKTVDAALSESSVNPVQNKAITAELKKKVDAVNLATINGQRIDEGGNIVIKGGGESSVFKAVYGVTTYEEIKAAYDSGKVVHCDYNSNCYRLSAILNDAVYFSFINQTVSYRIKCGVDNSWIEQYYPLQYAGDKTQVINESSTNSQYPSAKAVYDAIEGVKEKDYELLLDVTMDTDVDTFSVIDRVPNILSYKDYIILFEFKYQEGVTRKGVLSFYNANQGINVVTLDRIVTQNYLTHYILRIHRGLRYDKTAFLESHTNAFYNQAYDEFHKGLNIFAAQNNDDVFTNTCIFNFKFYAGEKIIIYGK